MSAGMFDSIVNPMKEKWESSKTGLQERQAEEAFRFQISSLVKKEKFGLEDFVQSIRYCIVQIIIFCAALPIPPCYKRSGFCAEENYIPVISIVEVVAAGGAVSGWGGRGGGA
jgi:hypothetical protein